MEEELIKDAKKDSALIAYIEKHAKRVELLERIIEQTPSLQKPINGRLVASLAVGFLLLFPLLLSIPRDLSFEEQIYNVVSVYLPILMTIALFYVNQRWLIERVFTAKRVVPYILVNLVLMAVCVLLRDIIMMGVDSLLSPADQSYFIGWTSEHGGQHGWVRLVVFVVMNFFLCFVNLSVFALGLQIQYFYRNYIRRQARLQAELSFLKMQVNQHFLFNTMNNIIAMMDIDAARAKKLMLSLSQILRTMLYETKESYIALQKEVDILKHYAEIEKLHFGDNLDFEFNVDLKNPQAKISPLILLPLVENVFKHSLNLNGRSFVKLTLTELDGVITFCSENSNFPRVTKRDDHHGVGLENLKKRLESIYGGHYEYTCGVEGNAYKSRLVLKP